MGCQVKLGEVETRGLDGVCVLSSSVFSLSSLGTGGV